MDLGLDILGDQPGPEEGAEELISLRITINKAFAMEPVDRLADG